MATVRYLVDDVSAAAAFYTEHLGFTLEQQMGSPFAIVSSGDLTLWLSGPESSAARPMPDGRQPEPGGWNRLVIQVEDLKPGSSNFDAPGSPSETRSSRVPAESRSCWRTVPGTPSSSSSRVSLR
jgi:catechol 2,3-dioxygenase-like lactoylglutathione lyase family enzyme